jgi:hypothetical protein
MIRTCCVIGDHTPTYSMQRAVAEGPNHSPGCLPHADAPCSTNLCIEKGALGSSAKSEIILRSSYTSWPLRQSCTYQ